MAVLLGLSTSTLERRQKDKKPLDVVSSERLDRVASIAALAQSVFEDQEAASRWLSTPNEGLGGNAPLAQCETEIGANQVRRILHALEWGGAA
jgi:putative toxin-antitoxin system antitoxin component (TIGR02293 family)